MEKYDDMDSRRAPNFSKLQERIILDMYVEKKDLLDAPLSRKVTKEMKDAEYDRILTAVNAADSSYKRSMNGLKEKLKSLKSKLKNKVAAEKKALKRTGGGPSEKLLTPHEEQLAEHFSEDPSFHGIGGGESGTGFSYLSFLNSANTSKYHCCHTKVSYLRKFNIYSLLLLILDENEDPNRTTISMVSDNFDSEADTPRKTTTGGVKRRRLMGPSEEEVRAEQLACLKKWSRNLDIEYELLLEKKRKHQCT